MDFLTIKTQTDEECVQIIQKLFDEYAIQTPNTLYGFVELEFYWNSPTHPDNSVYERNHANPKTGEWFLHYSGVDIALTNDELKGHGGILIRRIYDVKTGNITKGPQICMIKLFSGINPFSPSTQTRIIEYPLGKSHFTRKKRVGIRKHPVESGDNTIEMGAGELNFSIDLKKNSRIPQK